MFVVAEAAPRVIAQASLAEAGPDEFARLIEPHLPRMSHLAERLGGSANRDDIVQEALVNAWTKRIQFDASRGSLGGWLLAITADQARKSWRRRMPLLLRPPVVYPATTDEHIDIERAVLQLPPRQRLAIDCYYFAGLSVSETAVVMKCSEGTVKSTLSDARMHLRPALEVIE